MQGIIHGVCVCRVGGDLSAHEAFPRTETFHPWIRLHVVDGSMQSG